MTRATLLHVLDHTTDLGPAEVRELEQLAQAFPYCQTAHLLLAKAAHDQGTMLAGQRLRRAATYAADRTLLRRLIEQVEPARAEQPPLAADPVVVAPPTTTPEVFAPFAAAPAEAPAPPAPVAEVAPAATPVVEAFPVLEVAHMAHTPAMAEASAAASETVAALPVAAPIATIAAVVVAPEPFGEVPVEAVPVDVVQAPVPMPIPVVEPAPDIPVETVLLDKEGAIIPVAEPTIAVLPTAVAALEAVPEQEVEPEVEPNLPAQAPAIRPPVEVGEARFEFGLAEPAPAAVPTTYELPGLVDEWAAAAVTLSMGNPAAGVLLPAVTTAVPAAIIFTPAAFTGDAAVGYGFGESSRLGFALQLLNMLTDSAEAAEATTAPMAAAHPPTMPLPPAGAFFEPDPLLLAHWATHCPPVPALPSSFDLINNFLRRQPRLTRPAMLPPTPSAQADLSLRSTRAEPDLASESLARILVRQGKTARAIEIYEKLMVKQPEKMAYFAAQIQSLQPPA